MPMTPTTRMALPGPAGTDPADVPSDIDALRQRLDTVAAMYVQGAIATRPAAGIPGRLFYATDERALWYDEGSAWTTATAPRVTTLPASPVDGQQCDYVANPETGVIWRLRYRAASTSTHKWEFVGGADLYATYPEAQPLGFPVANAWYGLVKSPVLTCPLAGDYFYWGGADYMQIEKAVSTSLYMSVSVGPAGVSTTPLGPGGTLVLTTGGSTPVHMAGRLNGRAAGDAVRIAMAGGSTANELFAVGALVLALRPVRVG